MNIDQTSFQRSSACPFNLRFRESNLCRTCTYAHVITDHRDRTTTLCGRYKRAIQITAPVTQCSVYNAMNKMPEYEANRLGWVLEVKKGHVVGFKPPKQEA